MSVLYFAHVSKSDHTYESMSVLQESIRKKRLEGMLMK